MVAMCPPWGSWAADPRAVWRRIAGLAILLTAVAPAAAAEPRGPVYVIEWSGAIGVAASLHLDGNRARRRLPIDLDARGRQPQRVGDPIGI